MSITNVAPPAVPEVAPEVAPPRIGFWQAMGSVVNLVGVTAIGTTKFVETNLDSGNRLARTGNLYICQLEREAEMALRAVEERQTALDAIKV